MLAYRLAPARIVDAARLASMSHELIEAGLRPAWGTARIGWHVRHAESVVLTACLGVALAGFAIMSYADDSAHLNLLAVDPAHRRRGVAHAHDRAVGTKHGMPMAILDHHLG